MTFPLYFVYMVEATGMGEIARNNVEINLSNIFKQRVFSEVDKLGSKFYQKNSRKEKNLGDWEVRNDRGTVKRKLEISKGEEKQHLTISFEQKKMIGFDFILSDGNTIVSLQKNAEGKLVVLRKDKKGKPIIGSENLSPREYLELTNYPFKFALDRNVNAIVDTVDPNKIIRYVLPVASAVALGGKLALSQLGVLNNATSLRDAFLGPTPISQQVNNEKLSPKYSEIPNVERTDFVVLNDQDEKKYGDNKAGSDLIGDLKLVHEFTLPNTDGLTQRQAIEKFLMEAGIPSGELFRYRERETNNLPQSLKDAIDQLDVESMPYKEDTIYNLIKAIREFNGSSLNTPKDIIKQAHKYKIRKGEPVVDLWGAYQQTKDEITGQTNFNNGPIQVSELYESATPGSTIVNTGNQYGIVMAVSKDKSGNLTSVTIWRYDEITGAVTIEDITAEDFALNFR